MNDEHRIEALEIKCAHLERAVQELSDALYRQQQELDGLVARNEVLARQLAAVAEGGQGADPTAVEIPPHY